jgi:alkanesulfonate monooxygenase SsuD/methylene tetrahydromethanopterin reductase-like flavin-dependent oxidoreductase (luciferase family)
MFTEEAPTVVGATARVEQALNFPRPVSPGGPPILVGGGGERRTLRLVAQYADACNLFGDPDTIRHKLQVLDEHCAAVGRDPAEVSRTRLGTLVIAPTAAAATAKVNAIAAARGIPDGALRGVVTSGDPAAVTEQAAELLDAGLDGLIFNLPDAEDLDTVALAGEALAGVRGRAG